MSAVFKFKQFSIAQNLCAMKVGTDGVLLGAWTQTPNGTTLDIGSGTGVIALMIAQRNTTAPLMLSTSTKMLIYKPKPMLKIAFGTTA